MKTFEEDLFRMIENIEFRKYNDQFLNGLTNDLKKIKSSPNVFIYADKTTNIYETEQERYKQLLTNSITKTYKVGDKNTVEDIEQELKEIADGLSISDRIETMAKRQAFITLKDHKENFDNNPTCRLINPAKSDLGKVSKVLLDQINATIRSNIEVNQWRSTSSVIDWFKAINDKNKHSFLSFDVVDFYPSITEELLDKAISWASEITSIPDNHIAIIKHARRSVLFNGEKPWIKKNNTGTFDVTMGSFDGAEICELVGLFILESLAKKFGGSNVGLYRDDGLVLLENTTGRLADRARKDLTKIFDEFGLKITAQANQRTTNFLDVTLNLRDGKYQPFRKPNDEPLYVDSHSNHPPSIIKQLPTSINKRISSLSSDESSFNTAAPLYEDALKRSHFNANLHFTPDIIPDTSPQQTTSQRTRKRSIIWFNPPFSKNVKTNIGRKFLNLIDHHFTCSNLHKIFNRNTVKVSYSCMENVKTAISKHNHRILSRKDSDAEERKCNCRNQIECPLKGNCMIASVIYKADVTTTDDADTTKQYIGMTASNFKQRFNNHQKSFRDEKYSNETELSKHVWKLRRNGKSFTINWSVLKRAAPYTSGANRCNLCLEEKLFILKANKKNLLNKRTEIISKCRHENKFYAANIHRPTIKVTHPRTAPRSAILRVPRVNINRNRSETSLVA